MADGDGHRHRPWTNAEVRGTGVPRVYAARRYRRQPPSVVRLHPGMCELVPQTLRLALACIA